MAQIIRLRNVPTPVLEVTYDQVTYPSFMYGGYSYNMVPVTYSTLVYIVEGTQLATSSIIYRPSNQLYTASNSVEYEIGSVVMTARSF
jgi:hypothetical protein